MEKHCDMLSEDYERLAGLDFEWLGADFCHWNAVKERERESSTGG